MPLKPLAILTLVMFSARCLADAPGPAPSVLVTTTTLHHASLPHTIDAYGVAQIPAQAIHSVTATTSQAVKIIFVREAEQVDAGAPLVQLAPSPQTTAGYTQAQSAARVAEQLASRTRQLFAQHLATAQQLADAQKSASDAHANLAALTADSAGAITIIRSPYKAIVVHVAATAGALASAGTSLVELARPDGLVLKVGLVPPAAVEVNPGNPAQISATGPGRTCSGTVRQRGALIDPATGLVPVEIAASANCLLSGETARATITVGNLEGYVVPHAAILVDDKGHPYIVQANGMTARKVAVTIVGIHGKEDVVAGDGLNAEQPVVLSGNYQLDDGDRIRLAPSDAGAQ